LWYSKMGELLSLSGGSQKRAVGPGSPCSTAHAATAVLERSPRRLRTRCTWFSAVRSLIPSKSAISRLVWPCASDNLPFANGERLPGADGQKTVERLDDHVNELRTASA
jgi:hypothetical protein